MIRNMAKCAAHAKEHGHEQVPAELMAKIKGAIKEV